MRPYGDVRGSDQFSCIIVYYTEEKTPFGRIDRTPLNIVCLSIQKLIVGLGLDYNQIMSLMCLYHVKYSKTIRRLERN